MAQLIELRLDLIRIRITRGIVLYRTIIVRHVNNLGPKVLNDANDRAMIRSDSNWDHFHVKILLFLLQ